MDGPRMEGDSEEDGQRKSLDERSPGQPEPRMEEGGQHPCDESPQRAGHGETKEKAARPKGFAPAKSEDRDEREEGRQRGSGEDVRDLGSVKSTRKQDSRHESEGPARGQRGRRTLGRHPR